MKLLITFFLAFTYFSAPAQFSNLSKKKSLDSEAHLDFKTLDEDYGFREIILESERTSFSNLELEEEEGDTRYYSRFSDELKIEDFEIQPISYCFYKGKLMMISITTRGLANSRGLLQYLQNRYGKGPDGPPGRYVIQGQKAKLSYVENPKNHDAKVFIMSLPLTYTMFKEQKDKREGE